VTALPDSTGSGNVVNIKILTSSESLAVSHEDIPLRELSSHSPEVAVRSSGRLRASTSFFKADEGVHWSSPGGEVLYACHHIPIHAYTGTCTCIYTYLMVLLSVSIFLTCITIYSSSCARQAPCS